MKLFFCYHIWEVEYRQILDYPGISFLEARLFHTSEDGEGIVLGRDREGKTRYFRFGCDHDYYEVLSVKERLELGLPGTLGACEHAYVCSKCGRKRLEDSSD